METYILLLVPIALVMLMSGIESVRELLFGRDEEDEDDENSKL